MLRQLNRPLRAVLLAAAAATTLSACAQVVPRPKVQQPPETGRITFQPEQAVIDLAVDADNLLTISYDKGDPLPGDLVGPVEVRDMPLEEVLRLVTRANAIPVALGAGAEDKNISISIPGKLPLAKTVDLLIGQAGAFYEYRDGVLHVEGERTFSVRVPNVLTQSRYADLTDEDYDLEIGDDGNTGSGSSDSAPQDPASATSTIDAFEQSFLDLGASQVSANNRSGLITFYADKQTYKNIASFLRDFEINRDLIIYDAWIYEVQLSDAKQAGIDWNDLSKGLGGVDLNLNSGLGLAAEGGVNTGGSAVTLPSTGEALRGAGGITLGVMGNPGAWVIDAMFQFLNGQGEAKTLAQPTISVIGGREATVFVGESIAYINELRITDTDNGEDDEDDSSGNDDLHSTDVSTRKLKTGIRLGITGDVTNGVVDTDIGLSFVELLSMTNVELSGWVLQLPRTAERSLNTTIRARPGDVIMLGGLIYDRGSRSEDSLMLADIPLKAEAESTRTELVMMLRPRLVKFRPASEAVERAFMDAPLQIGPAELPHGNESSTSVVTPETPADVIMRKSVTREQAIIDDIKADPTAADLADEALEAITGTRAEPLPAPANPTNPISPPAPRN
mgnify:CR=1 FL=1